MPLLKFEYGLNTRVVDKTNYYTSEGIIKEVKNRTGRVVSCEATHRGNFYVIEGDDGSKWKMAEYQIRLEPGTIIRNITSRVG